jgi:5-methylcytosine-specific restriction endonuclease McrA
MPKGVPKNGLWRGKEKLEDWLKRQQPWPCACGCGELIIPRKQHRNRGFPRYILRHQSRVQNSNYRGVDKWIAAEQGRHVCACGCGLPITVLARHHSVGIPRYRKNHSPRIRLGCGREHPNYVEDRSLVKTRKGCYFTPAVMREVYHRCQGQCTRCGSRSDLQCDHTIPVFAGGTGDAVNGQILCSACHKLKTRFELVLTRSADDVRRFFRTLIAFVEFAQQEVTRNADHRNAADLS